LPRPLTPGTSVDHLRKEAKRWLKALRAHDPDARERLARAWPEAPPAPGLRDVQYALALEYGLPGWSALTAAVADLERAASPREQALHALLRAAGAGDVSTAGEILDAHPDLLDERGTLEGHTGLRTALHFGVHHEPIVRALLDRGANPNIRDEGDNAFPLHFAAERGDFPVIRLLVEHGAQTSAGEVDDHHLDIIGWATCFPAVAMHPEIVEYLLTHGARHTLHSAVATGDVDAIRARAREDPAAIERQLDRVIRHRRALHLAVLKDQPRSLETLLDLGADPDAVDAAGLTPLDEAALRGRLDMARLLVDRGARMTVAAAVALERADDLEKLLKEDPDVLKPGHRLATLIVQAAAEGPPRVIETLIRLGASVDVLDNPSTSVDETTGYTALHAAAFNGNLAAVEALLKHGANPRIRDGRYRGTPAGWASYARKPDVFDRLMAPEVEIDIFDAIDFDRPDRIREILRRDPAALRRPFGAYLPPGAKPAPWCPDPGVTPLVWATAENKTDAMRTLMMHGAELAVAGNLARTHDERVASFLRMACIDWVAGDSDRARLTHAADRLLQRHPEIAADSIFTAVACGDVDGVRRILDEHPERAREAGGPRGWPPLLYLCTARLPGHPASAANAVTIARMLLDSGTDPNAYHRGGNEDIHYTALTCVIGRGEEQAATHPEARQLAALLLEQGAEPYDVQVFYNGFAGHASHGHLAEDDLVWLLELIYRESIKRGRQADWSDPDWTALNMGSYGSGAWYLLHTALQGNYLGIAEWALSHGANPNPPRATDRRTPAGTLYEQAVLRGLTDFAELLARYGAPRTVPAEVNEFAAACLRRDRDRARALAAAHPEYLSDPALLISAAEHDLTDLAALLLDAGMSPDIENQSRARPLHFAAYSDSAGVARLLIERGAEIDPRDDAHEGTPIGWASFGQRRRMVDLLTPVSRDVWVLVPAAKTARVREVLAAEPRVARVSWDGGTPLFYLPDDEQSAVEIVKVFVEHGVDLSFRRKDGATAEEIARARGLDAAAELLKTR
jgi:ankyrin repeat protein